MGESILVLLPLYTHIMHTKKKKSAPLSLKNSESEIVLIIYFKDLEIVDSGVLNLKQMAKYLNLILVVQFKIREKKS